MNDKKRNFTNSFIKSLNYGFVWSYFCTDDLKGEKNEHILRKRFKELREDKQLKDSKESLNILNGFYNTRFKKEHLGALSISLKKIIESDHQKLRTGVLFERVNNFPQICQKAIMEIIQHLQEHKPMANRPYSLITKFMHFYNPKLFPIYDSRASESWNVVVKQFELDYSKKRWDNHDGKGYADICNLYLELWGMIAAPQQEKAKELIKNIATTFQIEFDILDAFDKFFWMASGHEDVLFEYDGPGSVNLKNMGRKSPDHHTGNALH